LSVGVLLVVLIGALLHASWNLLVKAGRNKHTATAIIYGSAGILSALALPFLAAPARASWPYLAASTVTELLYGVVLAAAYRAGDLSHAYPLMRGTAPLLVAIGSSVWVGERLSRPLWIGVALLSAALISMIFDARGRSRSASATALAILNAFLIATYTVIDGVGARKSGAPIAYSLWLFTFIAVPWLIFVGLRYRHRWGALRGEISMGLVGGACSLASYTVALWAVTRAPIAVVAAVRETSILFGALLGMVFLHERLGWVRGLAILGIATALAIIRLG
jgi:drug/metabolite transporter (DMT)-like permease